jgi:thiosulfate reductase cytochrome b subunit
MNERDWKQPDDKSNPSAAASSKPAVNQARDVSTGTTVRINYKHSLAIRWMHWINFPLLVVMIYSGLLIYWADSQYEGLNAHRVYRVGFGSWTLFRLFPTWFYNTLHLKFQLAKGLGYHFFFMWFLLTMGYVGFFLVHVAQVIRAGWNNFRAMIIGYQVSTVESAERDEVSDGQDIPAR